MAPSDPAPDQELVASIDDTCTGAWIITTDSGTRYLLDLDQRQLTRRPSGSENRAAELRRDHEVLELHSVIECAIGRPGLSHVQVRDDSISTVRMTTSVLEIRLRH